MSASEIVRTDTTTYDIKELTAEAAIAPQQLVKPGTTVDGVVVSTANADEILVAGKPNLSTQAAYADGSKVRVIAAYRGCEVQARVSKAAALSVNAPLTLGASGAFVSGTAGSADAIVLEAVAVEAGATQNAWVRITK